MTLRIEDVVMKSIFDLFKGDAIKFFGIDKRVVALAKTELNYVYSVDNFMDYTFLLDDDTYAHFEFQTTYRKEDLTRFLTYDALLYQKELKPVITMVIYSADIERAQSHLDIGSIKYEVKPFFMANMDGDTTYSELQAKITNEEKLTKQDLMSMVLLPIMKNSVDKVSRIEQCIKLGHSIDDKSELIQVYSMLDLFAEKFVKDKDRLTNIKELMNVSIIRDLYNEGIEKGMRSRDVEIAKNMLADNAPIETIAKYTGLPVEQIENLKIDKVAV